jgi:transketolase
MIATRKASQEVIQWAAAQVPELVGGSADLAPSTLTLIDGGGDVEAGTYGGRNLHFGIREHAMGAIVNALTIEGMRAYGATFLVFSDYMRGSVRLAALSDAHVIYSFTHDSVGVGEDGPTHQPVEHVTALRAIPGLRVIRPADANETAQSWVLAVNEPGPTALILSRQNLPVLEGTAGSDRVRLGAYVLVETDGPPDLVLIGTGSEVAVCVEAARELSTQGVRARVVSMPCWSMFDAQDAAYRSSVLPEGVPRLSVEAGVTLAWPRYADASVGIDRFGSSAPGDVALDRLGINAPNVVAHAQSLLESRRHQR